MEKMINIPERSNKKRVVIIGAGFGGLKLAAYYPLNNFPEGQILINYYEQYMVLNDLIQKTLAHIQRVTKIREQERFDLEQKIDNLQNQVNTTLGGQVYTYAQYLTAKASGTLSTGLIIISDQ